MANTIRLVEDNGMRLELEGSGLGGSSRSAHRYEHGGRTFEVCSLRESFSGDGDVQYTATAIESEYWTKHGDMDYRRNQQ